LQCVIYTKQNKQLAQFSFATIKNVIIQLIYITLSILTLIWQYGTMFKNSLSLLIKTTMRPKHLVFDTAKVEDKQMKL